MTDRISRNEQAEEAALIRRVYQDLAIPGQSIEVPAAVAASLGAVEEGTATEEEAEAAALDAVAE